jgi:hypothetical protein
MTTVGVWDADTAAIRLASAWIRTFKPRWKWPAWEEDEVWSDACYAASRAVQLYDPLHGRPLPSWAYQWISSGVARGLDFRKRRACRPIEGVAPVPSSIEPGYRLVEDVDQLERIIEWAGLTPAQRTALVDWLDDPGTKGVRRTRPRNVNITPAMAKLRAAAAARAEAFEAGEKAS